MEFKSSRQLALKPLACQALQRHPNMAVQGGFPPAQGGKGPLAGGTEWQRCGGGTEMVCQGTEWEELCALGSSVSLGWRGGSKEE